MKDDVQSKVFALVRQQVWHLRQPVPTSATTLADDLGLDSLEQAQPGCRTGTGGC